MMKRICIVGMGWLGKELGVKLKNLGHYVTGTTTSISKVDDLGEMVDEVKVLKLSDYNVSFLQGCDILIYTIPPSSSDKYSKLSCMFFHEALEINPNITIIYTSSTSVYGNEDRQINEKSLINPSSDSAKKISEVELCIQRNFNEWAIFRLGGLVGGKRHPVKYLAGRSGVSKPLAPVNLLHREDAVQAISHVLSSFKSGIYNLCSENHPPKKTFYNAIVKQNQMKAIEFDKNDISKDKVVTCSAIKESGFEFKYTSPYDFPFEF